jgi:hypothetical protein
MFFGKKKYAPFEVHLRLFAAALECGAAKHFLVFAAASVQQRPA